MATKPADSPVSPEVWSALMDGEAYEHEVSEALTAWRRDPGAQEAWHAYHLIGDTLRSSELSCTRAHDRRLLEAVKARLAAEPVVLAPEPRRRPVITVSDRRRWRRWTGSAAIVAGVGAVSAMVWLTQPPGAGVAPGMSLASKTPASASPTAPATLASTGTGLSTSPLSAPAIEVGPMLRDARIDDYLAAHRQLSAGPAHGTPAGYAVNRPAAGR